MLFLFLPECLLITRYVSLATKMVLPIKRKYIKQPKQKQNKILMFFKKEQMKKEHY
ncbi:hypothetical protein ETECTG_CDS0190 [Escherichia phage ETEC-TG]|nr:hypothetical protein [Escherichia phage vB_EcoM_EP57]WPK30705.1 hypothetical protein ETECTG_CDS0190 [Escherichia phage ETEC-TG]